MVMPSKNSAQLKYGDRNVATVVMITVVIGVLGLFTTFL
jgi:hypothetical protein